MHAASRPHPNVGTLIREWRQRRRWSQLDLACEADISTRHLSYVETGLSSPSREMLMHLAERLNLLHELQALPFDASQSIDPAIDPSGVAVPLQLNTPSGVMSFIGTTTVFGTSVDVTLSELALETFFPADAGTAEQLRRLSDGQPTAERR